MIKTLVIFATVSTLALLAGCGPDLIQRTIAKEEQNKQVVLDFYEKAVNQKNFEAAARHFGPRYIQHNPHAADGVDGFREFVEGHLKKQTPDSKSEIKRVFADGDHVILHVHAVPKPGARGAAIVDIFRLDDGKIVEHWDVIQDIPEKTANPNGMF